MDIYGLNWSFYKRIANKSMGTCMTDNKCIKVIKHYLQQKTIRFGQIVTKTILSTLCMLNAAGCNKKNLEADH